MPKVPWPALEALFHQTLARPQEERAVFLVARCAGQPEVQAQVEAMLRAHDAAGRRGNQSRMATHPALTAGTRPGAYEVLEQLGAPGMGEVHRARDARLGREVAIKILAATFAADAERVASSNGTRGWSPRSITRTSR
jgi:hypothetical protein